MTVKKIYPNEVATERLNVNMPTALMNEVRKIAHDTGLNKTSTVILMIKQYVDQQKVMDITSRIEESQRAK